MTPALQQVLGGQPPSTVRPAVWKDVLAFYTQRSHVPAWVDHRRPTDRAAEAIKALQTARQHGFDADEYGASDLLTLNAAVEPIDKESPERLQRVAEFDVRLTAALLSFGRDVAIGRGVDRSDPGSRNRKRTPPDLVATLAQAVDSDPLEWVGSIRPPHPEYAALQRALDDLHGQREKGGWPHVQLKVEELKVESAKGNLRGPAVIAVRKRLVASGHLKSEGDLESPAFGQDLAAAVRSFQELHAIKATGIIDDQTLAAMNVPLDERIRQVALNLERWRSMPDDLGNRHFLVNVPYFHLIAREGGKPVMDIRVVVGKPGQNTPLFSDEMESVVFSPYWNIPDSIAINETAPSVLRDPNFLARQNIEILRVSDGKAEAISASDVNWSDPGELKNVALRQRPGSSNALGHVKFLFPNSHNVYLHDTPADSLFERQGRAFSHGCVRVEEPEALAKYVLRDYPEWTPERMQEAMHSGVEKHVKLREKIPVHIVYFTAWVDENGGLHFQPDIYDYDSAPGTPSKPKGAAIS